MKTLALAALAALAIAAPASAAEVSRTYGSPTSAIAGSVTVPAGYETIYLSGMVPAPQSPAANGQPIVWGTTEQQTESVLTRINDALKALGLGPGDVVKMTVFLVGDPAKGGAMDFQGMMTSYSRHYGTPAQPNRPSRSTVQVSSLVAPGMLVEIEVIAVRKPAS